MFYNFSALKSDELPVKKLKEEPVDIDAEIALDKKIEKQNKTFFKYRFVFIYNHYKGLNLVLL